MPLGIVIEGLEPSAEAAVTNIQLIMSGYAEHGLPLQVVVIKIIFGVQVYGIS